MAGDKDTVRTLLKQGQDVNAAMGDGMTALHWAAKRGDVELAQMLLYAGANVKAMTRLGGYTPLLLASQVGEPKMIDLLLKSRCRSEDRHHQRHDAADARGDGGQRRSRSSCCSTRARIRTPRKTRAVKRR